MYEFQEAWFSLKISRQKSSCAWISPCTWYALNQWDFWYSLWILMRYNKTICSPWTGSISLGITCSGEQIVILPSRKGNNCTMCHVKQKTSVYTNNGVSSQIRLRVRAVWSGLASTVCKLNCSIFKNTIHTFITEMATFLFSLTELMCHLRTCICVKS